MNINEVTCKERITKYYERIEGKTRNKNQLLVKEGKGFLILGGVGNECIKLEGYIKLSASDDFIPINQGNYAMYILPKEKLIVIKDDRCEFIGYKSENTEGCIMAIHAVTERDDLLIIHVDDGLPAFISLDEFYDVVDNGNARIYQLVNNLLKKQFPSLDKNVNNGKVDENDEWE